jgi:hypothetical protein
MHNFDIHTLHLKLYLFRFRYSRNMNTETDLILGHVAFVADPRSHVPSIKTKVIQFADAPSFLPELFQDSSEFWNLRGIKSFKARRRTTEPLNNALRVLDHSRFIADALRRDLQLPKTPEALEITVRTKCHFLSPVIPY